jgi:hypothetical protein
MRRSLAWLVAIITTALTISGCSIFFPDKPTVVINSPVSRSQFTNGAVVSVQSTASDSKGIARVELSVDGNVVHIATPPGPETTFAANQIWTATSGAHTLTVRAFNVSNTPSDPAAVAVLVGTVATTPVAAPSVAQAAAPTPLSLPTLPPTVAPTSVAVSPSTPFNCANSSILVQDVTIPAGTTLTPGQPFDKVWRVRNTGTCEWGADYRINFIGGIGMTQTIAAPVPDTAPGGTADISVPMAAPTLAGSQTSTWQLRAPNGDLFGAALSVSILVSAPPTATIARCSGKPTIASFSASPTTITAGQSATLQWGFVSNADTAEIDQDIGGVATPGSMSVKPATTTTYTLTARCGSDTTTAQATINVLAPAPTAAPPPTATLARPTATPMPTLRPTTAGATIVRCSIQGESGEAIKAGDSFSASQALDVGDDNQNRTHRAFFSFDISDLAGKTIDQGNLTVGSPTLKGNPVALGPLFMESLQYSPPVVGTYFDRSGTQLVIVFGAPSGQYDLRSALQSEVRANRNRFQLRFRLAADNNGNSSPDMYTWTSNNQVCLSVIFH